MRKQNHKPVVNEFAVKINELIEKFVEKVGRTFQLMINEELVEKTRRYFGLDTKKPAVRKLADKPTKRKKKRVVKVKADEKSVVWETIKPARLTKPKRTKKRHVAPTESLVVEQANSKLPPVEIPKLDRKARFKQLKQLTRSNAKQKAIRVKNLIEGGRRDKNGKKRHMPHLILKKRDVQQAQRLNKPAEPMLVVNQFVDLPVFDPSNPSVVSSVKIQLSPDELNSMPDSNLQNEEPIDELPSDE